MQMQGELKFKSDVSSMNKLKQVNELITTMEGYKSELSSLKSEIS
jgi:hypothetical protein